MSEIRSHLATASPRHRADAESEPGLLEAAYRQAVESWPGVQVDRQVFLEHLVARLPAEVSLAEALAGSQVRDLYLACACLGGDRAAYDAFEAATSDVISVMLGRFDLSEPERKDVTQSLHVAFFVKKTLAGYSGRGALRGWVRAAATRAALDLVDSRKRRPDDEDELLRNLPATGDLELDHVRRRFSAEFREAFAQTVAALAPEDRAVLAQHYVDDLSIDQLAAVHGIHRATAARRVARLREALLEGTRARLQERMKLDASTFESLMHAAASQLDVSVFRLLRS